MVLYKLKQDGSSTTFVSVLPTTMSAEGLMEKVMENWLAENPYAVLPDESQMLVIDQEISFKNLTDILAVDQDGNLVVIEVKRGQTPRDVIAQAVEYASDVATWTYERLNQRAMNYFSHTSNPAESLLSGFQEFFGITVGEFDQSQFNQQQRIVIVGESIEPKIERAARWLQSQGVSIGCIAYTCYKTEDKELFLDFQTILEELAPSPGTGVNKPGPPTEESFLLKYPEAIRALYFQLRDLVISWPGVTTGATNADLKFVAGNNFAEIFPRKNHLQILVRPEGLDFKPGDTQVIEGIRVMRVPETYRWTLDHRFRVDETMDLAAVEKLLKQSYHAVYSI